MLMCPCKEIRFMYGTETIHAVQLDTIRGFYHDARTVHMNRGMICESLCKPVS